MRLDDQQIQTQLSSLQGWRWDSAKSTIWQDFKFNDFHQTMKFVNAVANIAHYENHHPHMEIGYNHCQVNYTTHSLGGLGEKDFKCARRIDKLK